MVQLQAYRYKHDFGSASLLTLGISHHVPADVADQPLLTFELLISLRLSLTSTVADCNMLLHMYIPTAHLSCSMLHSAVTSHNRMHQASNSSST